MLPLHPWYPTRSNCARNTPTCSPCKPFRRTRPFRRRAQGGPFNACLLSPHTDTGAPSVRLPVPIEPLADDLGILTPVPIEPLADDRGILIPAPLRPSYRCPPRPSCRYPLDPHAGTPSTPHTDKVISPGMKHSHPRERTLDEGPLQFEPSVRAAPSLRLSRTDGRRPTAPDGRFALPRRGPRGVLPPGREGAREATDRDV